MTGPILFWAPTARARRHKLAKADAIEDGDLDGDEGVVDEGLSSDGEEELVVGADGAWRR